MWEDLAAIGSHLMANPVVRAAVVIGSGRSFSSGVDLMDLATNLRAPLSPKGGIGRAVQAGLLNKIVSDEELEASALAWAETLAEKAPLALCHSKRLIDQAFDMTGDAITASRTSQSALTNSADFAEASGALLERRTPVFSGA
jgi:enoyl-CoA hydratase/carnithine racemase